MIAVLQDIAFGQGLRHGAIAMLRGFTFFTALNVGAGIEAAVESDMALRGRLPD